MKSFLTKHFPNVINDSVALARVFVVILFFENYLITFQNTSLFKLTIDLDSIQLAPFIWFFVFIAGCKAFWWFLDFIIIDVKSRLNYGNDHISFNGDIKFLAFLILLLTSFYFYNVTKDSLDFAPFHVKQYPFIFTLLMFLNMIALFVSSFIVFIANSKE